MSSLPVGFNHTCNSPGEVDNIKRWAQVNLMSLNLAKTKELVIKTRTSKPPPDPVNGIKQVLSLKLLGVIFQDNPTKGQFTRARVDFQPGSAHYPWSFFFLVYMNPCWLLFQTCFSNPGHSD